MTPSSRCTRSRIATQPRCRQDVCWSSAPGNPDSRWPTNSPTPVTSSGDRDAAAGCSVTDRWTRLVRVDVEARPDERHHRLTHRPTDPRPRRLRCRDQSEDHGASRGRLPPAAHFGRRAHRRVRRRDPGRFGRRRMGHRVRPDYSWVEGGTSPVQTTNSSTTAVPAIASGLWFLGLPGSELAGRRARVHAPGRRRPRRPHAHLRRCVRRR